MAPKWYDDFLTDFDIRYARWVTATEAGEAKDAKAAAAGLPTLNKRLLRRLTDLDETEPNLATRAAQKRLIVLTSEIAAEQERRRRKRREATQRRADRTVRAERTVELPTTCVRCGAPLDHPKTTGRPRLYCSPACRKAAYEDRRAKRDGAVKIQVVEKLITEIRERPIEVPHPPAQCLTTVLANDNALVTAVDVLTNLVQHHSQTRFPDGSNALQRLRAGVDTLHNAFTQRS